jgi:hypothetical protein
MPVCFGGVLVPSDGDPVLARRRGISGHSSNYRFIRRRSDPAMSRAGDVRRNCHVSDATLKNPAIFMMARVMLLIPA